MKFQSRFIFTDPIFFDGVGWNYLKYDGFKNKIEDHVILEDRIDANSYLAYFNIMDKNVHPEVIDDCLILTLDNGKAIVRLTLMEKKFLFFKKRYIRSHYKFLPRDKDHIEKIKIRNEIRTCGNEKWDMIANFLNRAIN